MREAVQVIAPTTAASVASLIAGIKQCNGILLQAEAANATNVNFGSAASQPFFIVPGGDIPIFCTSTNNIFIKGNGSDLVNIGIL